jgi:hypothetical protein
VPTKRPRARSLSSPPTSPRLFEAGYWKPCSQPTTRIKDSASGLGAACELSAAQSAAPSDGKCSRAGATNPKSKPQFKAHLKQHRVIECVFSSGNPHNNLVRSSLQLQPRPQPSLPSFADSITVLPGQRSTFDLFRWFYNYYLMRDGFGLRIGMACLYLHITPPLLSFRQISSAPEFVYILLS